MPLLGSERQQDMFPLLCSVVMCDSLRLQLSGGCELTVVLQDFTAGCSTELSVSTGETCSHFLPKSQFHISLK